MVGRIEYGKDQRSKPTDFWQIEAKRIIYRGLMTLDKYIMDKESLDEHSMAALKSLSDLAYAFLHRKYVNLDVISDTIENTIGKKVSQESI